MGWTLPRGYFLPPPGRCPACGRHVEEVDRVEGLPIYQCPDRCGQDEPDHPALRRPEMTETVPGTRAVTIDYTNHRGERATRTIIPHRLVFGSNHWHPESQWLLEAEDLGRGQRRTFAVKDIHSWTPEADPR